VVFATLNTTRARLDLIQQLAKIRVSDKALSKNPTALIERFSESTKVRNELNHCMFIFDCSGTITHTQSMRLMETRSSLRFGEIKALDESRLQEMLRTTHEMTKTTARSGICCSASKRISAVRGRKACRSMRLETGR
jgi:hypothetical protein